VSHPAVVCDSAFCCNSHFAIVSPAGFTRRSNGECGRLRDIAVSPPHERDHFIVTIQIEGQMMKFIPTIHDGAVQFPVDNRQFTQERKAAGVPPVIPSSPGKSWLTILMSGLCL
jgi:hypothetical protein